MIPEAAVEAAARALNWHNTRCKVPTASYADEARVALEAAAAHMLAAAWDAGEEAGQDNADSNRGFGIEHKRNPYRPTK